MSQRVPTALERLFQEAGIPSDVALPLELRADELCAGFGGGDYLAAALLQWKCRAVRSALQGYVDEQELLRGLLELDTAAGPSDDPGDVVSSPAVDS